MRAAYAIARVPNLGGRLTKNVKDIDVVFITDPDFPKNKELMDLMTVTPDATVINFYTMDIDELSFIAKYRILPAYTILIMRGQKVIGRLVNKFPKKSTFKQMLKDLE